MRLFSHGSGDCDAHEKCADSGRDLEPLRNSGDEKDHAKNGEKYDLIGPMSNNVAKGAAVADSEGENQKYGG